MDRVLASEAKGRGFDPRQPHHQKKMFPALAAVLGDACISAPGGSFLMNFDPYIDMAAYLLLRVASYALLNLGEDAALIALMFC